MNPSLRKIDRLVFQWDCESVDSKKSKNPTKITSTTRRDLEEYFAFLDDVAPDPDRFKHKQIPVDKVFELNDSQ